MRWASSGPESEEFVTHQPWPFAEPLACRSCPNEIEISVEGDTLTVGGEYATTDEDGEQRHARRAGRFQYRTLLPKGVAADRIGAALADGVLRVSIPKTGETQPRTIEITEG